MRRALVLSALTLVLLVPAAARAQIERGALLVTGGTTWITQDLEEFDGRIEEWGITFGIEKLIGTRWAFGFTVTYRSEEEAASDQGQPRVVKLSGFPNFFTLRHLVGSGRLAGFAGGGFGQRLAQIQVSDPAARDAQNPGILLSETRHRPAVTAFAGVDVFVSRTLYLDLRYSLLYTINSEFEKGPGHGISAQLGIQFY
jgi:hypothetical protein